MTGTAFSAASGSSCSSSPSSKVGVPNVPKEGVAADVDMAGPGVEKENRVLSIDVCEGRVEEDRGGLVEDDGTREVDSGGLDDPPGVLE